MLVPVNGHSWEVELDGGIARVNVRARSLSLTDQQELIVRIFEKKALGGVPAVVMVEGPTYTHLIPAPSMAGVIAGLLAARSIAGITDPSRKALRIDNADVRQLVLAINGV